MKFISPVGVSHLLHSPAKWRQTGEFVEVVTKPIADVPLISVRPKHYETVIHLLAPVIAAALLTLVVIQYSCGFGKLWAALFSLVACRCLGWRCTNFVLTRVARPSPPPVPSLH